MCTTFYFLHHLNIIFHFHNYNYKYNRVEATYKIKFKRLSLDKTHNIYYIDFYLSDLADFIWDEKAAHRLEGMYKCTYKYENGILYL